jgi:hypothetical protein
MESSDVGKLTGTGKQQLHLKKDIYPTKPSSNPSNPVLNSPAMVQSTNKSSKSVRDPVKKMFRVVVRKLPVRDFGIDDLNLCLDKVCNEINLNRDTFVVEHFSGGKISRKRGPVFGAGFITVGDEAQYTTFLQNCPSKCPFIAGPESCKSSFYSCVDS